MHRHIRSEFLSLAVALALAFAVTVPANLACTRQDAAAAGEAHDDEHAGDAGHAEEGHEHVEAGDEHEGGPEPAHDDHDDAAEEVRVAAHGTELAGLRVERVREVVISRTVVLPGEVGYNEERRVHVTPRYGGVILEMRAELGSAVGEGDVLAVVESNENLTAYKVRAPQPGRVVAREGAVGAFASEEASLFVIADLSTVWVNLDVFPRHVADVATGMKVSVRGVGADLAATGSIDYVAPVIERERRVALARVKLANPAGRWRPGTFVRAEVHVAGGAPVPAVEHEAVQMLGDQPVVFVPEGDNSFRAEPVSLGASGPTHTEVRSGLAPGDAYVARGAFELKARAVTSSLGGHAGHGH
ncbi:MAG: efflux RND transporter periplasmic adaptor subunit [bacterium]